MADSPTAKDTSQASDLIALRRLLLRAPEVQQRLDTLAAIRPLDVARVATRASDGEVTAQPEAAVQDLAAASRYYAELPRLADDLDGAWSAYELHYLVGRWLRDRARLAAGAGVTASMEIGRPGTHRRMTTNSIELAACSLALRAGGMAASAADERVADAAFLADRSTVARYRQRLRRKLDRA